MKHEASSSRSEQLLESIQRGVDFIESNLHKDIDSADVSREACLSRWHFQRIFKAITNETLKGYIRGRRMSAAFDALLDTGRPIIDIAMESGFDSQSSFSKAFKKHFGISPNTARTTGKKKALVGKTRLDRDYIRHISQNISQTPEIFEQKPMTVVGMKTLFHSVDSEKNNIAERLPELWQAFVPRMDEIPFRQDSYGYGIIQQTSDDSDLLEYLAACAVSHLDRIPDGMIALELPAATYASFRHQGRTSTINDTVNYIYSGWLLEAEVNHTWGPDIEFYGDEFNQHSDDSVVYYSIPVADN